jgi:hypothetical protein
MGRTVEKKYLHNYAFAVKTPEEKQFKGWIKYQRLSISVSGRCTSRESAV